MVANNTNGSKKLLPWIGVIATITVLASGAFVKWGRTEQRVAATEKRLDEVDQRVVEEFKKIRIEQREWRTRDAEDRKRSDATMQAVQRFLNSLRPTMP